MYFERVTAIEVTKVKSLMKNTVASPGLVVRKGKDGNYVMGHSRWTYGPGAAAAR